MPAWASSLPGKILQERHEGGTRGSQETGQGHRAGRGSPGLTPWAALVAAGLFWAGRPEPGFKVFLCIVRASVLLHLYLTGKPAVPPERGWTRPAHGQRNIGATDLQGERNQWGTIEASQGRRLLQNVGVFPDFYSIPPSSCSSQDTQALSRPWKFSGSTLPLLSLQASVSDLLSNSWMAPLASQ